MKNLFTFLFVLFLSFSSAFAFVSPDNETARYNTDYPPTSESLHNEAVRAESSAQWRRFSVNLIQALQSSHKGVQATAMRYVILYADHVEVSEAAIDVMRIYRNDDDLNRRRMAVVTLGSMKNQWAFRFLERSVQFEKSEIVAQTIMAVLARENA